MARIVITIEGDSQEIGAIQEVLQRLAGLAAGEFEVSELPRVPGEREAWTFEEFRQFWSRLQDGARQILAEIAKRPEGYPMVELERALGVPARVIGGRLSSVGHAMRRFPHKEEPVEFRTGGDEAPGRRIYFMRPEIARMIRRLASEGAAEEAADS
ncbi:hypothetical protein NET03_01575 [Thermomicrobium sp. CFH 73360]|uniref:hypothetical protein n=1 Tax=Thermomicrobium sp. CFH 73360 TaxID=2951987 RepID=UPI0020767C6E|nr:hypothetical protein [Thermomicrobium sp. CFH 73360]MCM8745214.1 hypothetical protein [Thermomicrobium sp. CFH 73360]